VYKQIRIYISARQFQESMIKDFEIFGLPYHPPAMLSRKQQQLASMGMLSSVPPVNPQRRAGVDKAKVAKSLNPILCDDKDEDLAATQLIDVSQTQDWTDQREIMAEDSLLDEASSEEDDEAFNAQAEEIFLDKLDTWFAEYAPKLFDLAFAKNFAKQVKKNQKQKEESSETSRRPATKKKRTH